MVVMPYQVQADVLVGNSDQRMASDVRVRPCARRLIWHMVIMPYQVQADARVDNYDQRIASDARCAFVCSAWFGTWSSCPAP